MSKQTEDPPRRPGETAHYEDDPFALGGIDESKLVVVEDFLPRPEELIFKNPRRKITITLDQTNTIANLGFESTTQFWWCDNERESRIFATLSLFCSIIRDKVGQKIRLILA